jgi:hypothetical protein
MDTIGRRRFTLLVILLIGIAIARSAISTRLDSFTQDEAYHIAAGVSYVKYRDFRINPEHPPFVKLWIGAVLAGTGFQLASLRRFNDKPDEREFTEDAVFLKNDPDSVQRRARMGMWILNGLLLLALTLAAERVLGTAAALGALLYLVIDPTVAAHLPVVMTDLPVALATTTAILCAIRVFRKWLWSDVLLCSTFLGLALATKHSAPVVLISVALAGMGVALLQPMGRLEASRAPRLVKLAVLLAASLVVLWAFYGFRYRESRNEEEQFNRPLSQKILDVDAPSYRLILTAMSKMHIVPRAYIWGFADTVHAGMEGRMITELAFGRTYDRKAPWYFFPGVIAVKLPIGLGLLSVLGIALFIGRRLPAEWNFAGAMLFVTLIVFFLVLSRAATYAGIRHAIPVVTLLGVFGGIGAAFSLMERSRMLKVIVALAYLGAAVSAFPALRPWEYFNEIVGGSQNAYKYFSDEGVDCGQRNKELVNYYHRFLLAAGVKPELLYLYSAAEMKARGVDFLGRDMKRDFAEAAQPSRSGTIFASPVFLFHKSYWDRVALRDAKPVARFGNLFVYSGSFYLPPNAALTLYFEGRAKLFGESPDLEAAKNAFREAAKFDASAYFVNIDLGNVCVLRGEREEALQAYRTALQYVGDDSVTRHYLEKQIERVSTEDLEGILPVRDPAME